MEPKDYLDRRSDARRKHGRHESSEGESAMSNAVRFTRCPACRGLMPVVDRCRLSGALVEEDEKGQNSTGPKSRKDSRK